jgi:hypothetical protein
MTTPQDLVFLLDVDNTLLDNDQVIADLRRHLECEFGAASAKEQMLDSVQRHYPARRYVMVDDKLRILAAMKAVMQDRLTTVFPRQGHYALDPANVAAYPGADLSVERIGDLIDVDNRATLASQEK